ncbi:diphthamide biosynthesis protein 2 [Biomphalaria glabrata]|nr:diphthamide biosynthesis protein 2-like [Biomphalaria glabrata]KAI8786696.1 diphthamide biosynthesis protein 2 [Biomphalaria glabrata]
MLSTKVFSSGDNIQNQKILCNSTAVHPDKLEEVYETERSLEWVISNSFKKIALQFPDDLLVDAPTVAEILQEKLQDCTVFILGDTSYGSCCVDEVAAQHYGADCIIHYGHTCLSPTSKLPVLYIFTKSEVDIDDCMNQMLGTCTEREMKAILVCSTAYLHAIDKLFLKLKEHYRNVLATSLVTSKNSKGNDSSEVTVITKCGRRIEIPAGDCLNNYSFIYIGSNQGPELTVMMMTLNKCRFYTYDPTERIFRWEQVNMNKALMKRYYYIERAKDANIVGIVVGTLGVSRYKEMIDHLKALLKKSGKKSYTFMVGKLNPAKLANFAEVDLYVLVACPESSLLDQSEFYQPIISPLELEIACNQARQWTGDYSLDFTELLPRSALYIEAPNFDSTNDDLADVSLINNRVRTIGMQDTSSLGESPSTDVSLINANMSIATIARNAGEFLSTRSWKGLEQKLGETAVSLAVQGQCGIAAGYENEPAS